MARPPMQKDVVTSWLQRYLAHGSVAVADIRKRSPASWRTTNSAKALLGIKTKNIRGRWFWMLPGAEHTTTPAVSDAAHEPDVIPFEESEESVPLYTEDMLKSIRYWHTQGETEAQMLAWLIRDCKQYPTEPAYPQDYIRALIAHIVTGKPRPTIPEGIDEPF
jgi:hypothetical protein